MDIERRTDELPFNIVEEQCNCAGVLLIKLPHQGTQMSSYNDSIKILLVQGRWSKYNFSFPKGKRRKNESTLKAAKRELLEESGLDEQEYIIFPRSYYVEYRTDIIPKKAHICYYMAILKNPDVQIDPIDKKEVLAADWYTPKEIYQMKRTIYLQRQQIVTRLVRDLLGKSRNVIQRSLAYDVIQKEQKEMFSRESNNR